MLMKESKSIIKTKLIRPTIKHINKSTNKNRKESEINKFIKSILNNNDSLAESTFKKLEERLDVIEHDHSLVDLILKSSHGIEAFREK